MYFIIKAPVSNSVTHFFPFAVIFKFDRNKKISIEVFYVEISKITTIGILKLPLLFYFLR